jgi:glucose-1-phosphate thymidylyltransferase
LERICEKLEKVDEIIIVSNHKFIDHFSVWSGNYNGKHLTVIAYETTNNENRLGMLQDIIVAVDELQIEEDIMVLAVDNLFEFELDEFVFFL